MLLVPRHRNTGQETLATPNKLHQDTPPIDVDVERRDLDFVDARLLFQELEAIYELSELFLLESLSGPQVDAKSAVIGQGRLLSISVRGRRLTMEGDGKIRAMVLAHIHHLGEPDDHHGLRLPSDDMVWQALETIKAAFRVTTPATDDQFSFGFFGFFGYDTIRLIEQLPRQISCADAKPEISLHIFKNIINFDLHHRTCTLFSAQAELAADTFPTADEFSQMAFALKEKPFEPRSSISASVPKPSSVSDSIDEAEYLKKANQTLRHIRDGDVYQLQLGHEIVIQSAISPQQVYDRLRERNPAPFMFLCKLEGLVLIGASPEIFVKIESGKVTMRPLAGTIPISLAPDDIPSLEQRLLNDDKEVAEHIMLVDLCRNDIGRICVPGSLKVDQLLGIERYSHVLHIVSNVAGQLSHDMSSFDIIKAAFPAGTMIGTPKVRAAEIIEELEVTRRGVYAGTIGLIDFNGYVNTALCIRCIELDGDRYKIRASAGIVADSVPKHEWRETLAKMGATYWAITGEEIPQ